MNVDEMEWSDEEDLERYCPKVISKHIALLEEREQAEEFRRTFPSKRSSIFSGMIELHPRVPSMTLSELCNSLYSRWMTPSKMIPIESLYNEHCTEVIQRSWNGFDRNRWVRELAKFEKDDFISLEHVGELLENLFGSFLMKNEEAQYINTTTERPICTCAHPACRHPSHVKEVPELPEDEFSSAELFRIQVVYNRMLMAYNGKVRVRHVGSMLKELNIPFDSSYLPKEFWVNSGEFILRSVEEFKALITKIRVVIPEEKDPLDHLYKYKLPGWLREEFTAAEILLYQHHFSIIDADAGGSIDVHELQHLFSSLGSQISLDQAQALIDEYDLDGGGTIDFVEFMVLIYKVQRGTIDLADNGLAKVLNEAKTQLKIFEEIEAVSLAPPNLCSVTNFGGTPVVCEVAIEGPPASPYEGSVLLAEITFNDGYPYVAPDIQIVNRIISVNFMMQLNGRSRILHIGDVWSPDWSLELLLEHIVEVLWEPKADLLPDRFYEIVRHWQQVIAQEMVNEGGEEGNDGHNLINVPANAVDQEAGQEKEPEQDLESSTPGKDSAPCAEDKCDASERKKRQFTLDSITPENLKNRIISFPRIEQMHLSILFLYATDPASFFNYAREIARRFSAKSK